MSVSNNNTVPSMSKNDKPKLKCPCNQFTSIERCLLEQVIKSLLTKPDESETTRRTANQSDEDPLIIQKTDKQKTLQSTPHKGKSSQASLPSASASNKAAKIPIPPKRCFCKGCNTDPVQKRLSETPPFQQQNEQQKSLRSRPATPKSTELEPPTTPSNRSIKQPNGTKKPKQIESIQSPPKKSQPPQTRSSKPKSTRHKLSKIPSNKVEKNPRQPKPCYCDSFTSMHDKSGETSPVQTKNDSQKTSTSKPRRPKSRQNRPTESRSSKSRKKSVDKQSIESATFQQKEYQPKQLRRSSATPKSKQKQLSTTSSSKTINQLNPLKPFDKPSKPQKTTEQKPKQSKSSKPKPRKNEQKTPSIISEKRPSSNKMFQKDVQTQSNRKSENELPNQNKASTEESKDSCDCEACILADNGKDLHPKGRSSVPDSSSVKERPSKTSEEKNERRYIPKSDINTPVKTSIEMQSAVGSDDPMPKTRQKMQPRQQIQPKDSEIESKDPSLKEPKEISYLQKPCFCESSSEISDEGESRSSVEESISFESISQDSIPDDENKQEHTKRRLILSSGLKPHPESNDDFKDDKKNAPTLKTIQAAEPLSKESFIDALEKDKSFVDKMENERSNSPSENFKFEFCCQGHCVCHESFANNTINNNIPIQKCGNQNCPCIDILSKIQEYQEKSKKNKD